MEKDRKLFLKKVRVSGRNAFPFFKFFISSSSVKSILREKSVSWEDIQSKPFVEFQRLDISPEDRYYRINYGARDTDVWVCEKAITPTECEEILQKAEEVYCNSAYERLFLRKFALSALEKAKTREYCEYVKGG